MAAARIRRRWYQFSVRTMFLVLALTSLPLSYVAWEREQCRRGEAARKMIHRHDSPNLLGDDFEDLLDEFGDVSYRRPEWLKAVLGNDRFRRVHSVWLDSGTLTEVEMRQLEALPNLRDLTIYRVDITPQGLSQLRGLIRLERFAFVHNAKTSADSWEVLSDWQQLCELSFDGSDFRNEDVPSLSVLKSLKRLQLSGTKITDAGLKGIAPLTDLEVLDLSGTEVTDAGLKHLSNLLNLRVLNLAETKVRGSGLVHLAALPKLESLNLSRCGVKEEGLASLAGFSRLEGLGLSRTELTDAGLSRLTGLTSLKRLGLRRTNVTDVGMTFLRELSNLEKLDLSKTALSDKGLVQLGRLTNLKTLFLRGSNITDAGTKNFASLLPETVLDSDGSDPFSPGSFRVTEDGFSWGEDNPFSE